MAQKTVLAIGRWMPIHLGHKKFLVNLAKQFDKLVIAIGSCYENGTARNCIPAAEREKLLRKILKTEGIPDEKVEIIPVEDRETFEEWIDDVLKICRTFNVTHFCTGNKEDILNVLNEKGIVLDLEMINPEDGSDFPYHATDIRNAIINGETHRLDDMIPSEIKELVMKNLAKEIIASNNGNGKKFIPGRQTVDTVFLVRNSSNNNIYILMGTRNSSKTDFPDTDAIPGGGIEQFESPFCAVTRTFFAETGIKMNIVDNSDEPAIITIDNISDKPEKLNFTGIYASPDKRINGTLGGGSQCFSVLIDGDIDRIAAILNSTHDLENLRFTDINHIRNLTLAYEQKQMVYDTLEQLGIDFDSGEEQLAVYDENGKPADKKVSRSFAHKNGILHAASHTYIYDITDEGTLRILLQKRSPNKDSFPGCLDISSAGHVEYGMDFITTAVKELKEELGLDINPDELTEVMHYRFSDISEFYGRQFNNQEFNAVYILRKRIINDALILQEEELSGTVWMDVSEIIRKLEKNDSDICLDKHEFNTVLTKICTHEGIIL